jgi:hypothetical protein
LEAAPPTGGARPRRPLHRPHRRPASPQRPPAGPTASARRAHSVRPPGPRTHSGGQPACPAPPHTQRTTAHPTRRLRTPPGHRAPRRWGAQSCHGVRGRGEGLLGLGTPHHRMRTRPRDSPGLSPRPSAKASTRRAPGVPDRRDTLSTAAPSCARVRSPRWSAASTKTTACSNGRLRARSTTVRATAALGHRSAICRSVIGLSPIRAAPDPCRTPPPRSRTVRPRGSQGAPVSSHPHTDPPIRSRCAHVRPRFHPHLGTTLWMRTVGPVDGRRRSGGQPVPCQGTSAPATAPSTVAPRCPPSVPRRRPQHATPSELRGRRPSTLPTGPSTAAGSLFFMNYKKIRGVQRAAGSGGSDPRDTRRQEALR